VFAGADATHMQGGGGGRGGGGGCYTNEGGMVGECGGGGGVAGCRINAVRVIKARTIDSSRSTGLEEEDLQLRQRKDDIEVAVDCGGV